MPKITRYLFLLAGLSAACTNSSSPNGGNSPTYTVTLSLARLTTSSPNPIAATATALDSNGNPTRGLQISITATGANASTVVDNGNGTYAATLTPQFASGEIPIMAQVQGTSFSATKTAVVIPTIGSGWGQPEEVQGAVNTAGYQDGAQISPDGKWLVVSDYSPIDLFCCINGCGLQAAASYNSSYCQTSLGPYGPPLRPSFPGASRILSNTHILNYCPSTCYTSSGTSSGGELTTIPLAPVGSYIFQRQADGSFSQPNILGFAADGCAVGEGYTFAAAPSGNTAQLVYAWNPPYQAYYNTYTSTITLGSPNNLGTLSCSATTQYSFSISAQNALPLITSFNGSSQTRGNPAFHINANYIWFDDDGANVSANSLYYATYSGTLPNTQQTSTSNMTFSSFATVAAGTPANGHKQPYFDSANNLLYYVTANGIVASALSIGAPSSSGSWAAESAVLSPEVWTTFPPNRANSIGSIGQPSIAGIAATGKAELYFIYVLWTGTGTNFHVGVVRHL